MRCYSIESLLERHHAPDILVGPDVGIARDALPLLYFGDQTLPEDFARRGCGCRPFSLEPLRELRLLENRRDLAGQVTSMVADSETENPLSPLQVNAMVPLSIATVEKEI